MTVVDAAVEAARIRLRPIFDDIARVHLGLLPLVLAQGAGRAGRVSVGTTVFEGNDCCHDAEPGVHSRAVCDCAQHRSRTRGRWRRRTPPIELFRPNLA